MPHRLDAESEQEDPECGEDPGLYDGDGMQERADRSGGHHGGGQPAVHGHHGVLGKTKQKQGKYDIKKHRLRCHRRSWEDSAAVELERSGHVLNHNYVFFFKEPAPTEKINDVLASADLG